VAVAAANRGRRSEAEQRRASKVVSTPLSCSLMQLSCSLDSPKRALDHPHRHHVTECLWRKAQAGLPMVEIIALQPGSAVLVLHHQVWNLHGIETTQPRDASGSAGEGALPRLHGSACSHMTGIGHMGQGKGIGLRVLAAHHRSIALECPQPLPLACFPTELSPRPR